MGEKNGGLGKCAICWEKVKNAWGKNIPVTVHVPKFMFHFGAPSQSPRLVIPSNLGDSTVGATRRAWRTLFTTFCPRGRIRRIRREGDNITGMLAFAIVDTTSRLLLLNHDMAGVIHVELSRGTRAGIMITAPSTVQWPACIFFSPTNFTFSPTLSLFRQVGSLFRQVGSLFRQVGSLFRHKRIF